MKILLPNGFSKNDNPFLIELAYALERRGIVIKGGKDLFWNTEEGFDIIHIHWPEHLLRRDHDDLEVLFNRIEQIKISSRLVITRHNSIPHSSSKLGISLYERIFPLADGVIHLGNYSKKEYLKLFQENSFDSNKQVQVVIPHHLYSSIPNTITKQRARKSLKIPDPAFVILVFGAIRHDYEINDAITVFEKLPIKSKYLIAPRWNLSPRLGGGTSLPKRIKRKMIYGLNILKYTLNKRYRFNIGMVPTDEVQLYLNACDVVLISRRNALNSGNLPLAFSFSKPVVGPKYGNIGELLEETENPTYIPGDIYSMKAAIMRVYENNTGLGIKNYNYGTKNWNLDTIAEKHLKLYQELIKTKLGFHTWTSPDQYQ